MCDETLSISILLYFSGAVLLCVSLENIIFFDFLALNITFHLSAHCLILNKSLFSLLVVRSGVLSVAVSVVSSANMNISDSIFSIISFIKIKNKRGPRRLPCGTPALIYGEGGGGHESHCAICQTST